MNDTLGARTYKPPKNKQTSILKNVPDVLPEGMLWEESREGRERMKLFCHAKWVVSIQQKSVSEEYMNIFKKLPATCTYTRGFCCRIGSQV